MSVATFHGVVTLLPYLLNFILDCVSVIFPTIAYAMADMEFDKGLDGVDALYNELYEPRQRGTNAGKEEIVLG
jgi:hypothetical protein